MHPGIISTWTEYQELISYWDLDKDFSIFWHGNLHVKKAELGYQNKKTRLITSDSVPHRI